MPIFCFTSKSDHIKLYMVIQLTGKSFKKSGFYYYTSLPSSAKKDNGNIIPPFSIYFAQSSNSFPLHPGPMLAYPGKSL